MPYRKYLNIINQLLTKALSSVVLLFFGLLLLLVFLAGVLLITGGRVTCSLHLFLRLVLLNLLQRMNFYHLYSQSFVLPNLKG